MADTLPTVQESLKAQVADLEEQYYGLAQKQIDAYAEWERIKGEMTDVFWKLSWAKTKLKEAK